MACDEPSILVTMLSNLCDLCDLYDLWDLCDLGDPWDPCDLCDLCVCASHMHFGCAAAQQVDERSIEGHDGIAKVDGVILLILAAVAGTKHTRKH